jgi:hypothetical protein
VPVKGGEVTADETPRATTLDGLAALRPAFAADGVVTAGTSSPLSDGASAVVVASEQAVRRHGLVPRARIVGGAAAGVEPHLMGLGPVPATEKVLARAGWSVADLAATELNEAFAVQVLACADRLGLDEATLNADGGAIALGHPLGSSGCRSSSRCSAGSSASRGSAGSRRCASAWDRARACWWSGSSGGYSRSRRSRRRGRRPSGSRRGAGRQGARRGTRAPAPGHLAAVVEVGDRGWLDVGGDVAGGSSCIDGMAVYRRVPHPTGQ